MRIALSLEEYEIQSKKETYEQHPCRNCVWATWQKEAVVMWLFARCMKEKNK
ncbi:hypothetical protein ACFOU2_21340 [Bacillus songklensis]|uniref:Uncharacterized protein n=1 Tax=Bacillus songklensis TaxID=1069116 RepID=A0ABV8B8R5_9BACI